MNTQLKIIKTLTGDTYEISYNDLFNILRENYDEDMPNECENLYERFDMTKQPFKVHFDFDKKLKIEDYKKFDYIGYKTDIINAMKKIFNINPNEWAISEDNRIIKINKIKYYKISYHFVCINKYMTTEYFKKFRNINKYFNALNINFDTSIYRNGETRFRIPLCRKDNDVNSVLKPETYKNDLDKHLIQIIDNCDKLVINEDIDIFIKSNMSSSKNIKNILKDFDILDTKIINKIKIHNVGRYCPFIEDEHKSNNTYLVEKSDCLLHKCFDEDCARKVKVLYTNKKDYSLFSIKHFNSIIAKKGQDDNYLEKRDYFEKHYKYLIDQATLYRVDYDVNELGLYQQKIVEVKEKGLSNLKYDIIDKKKGWIKKSFYKRYINDETRKELYKVAFDPRFTNDNIYNLFSGWNYENILDEDDEITTEDSNDLDYLLKHIKENICDNNNKIFDFFISQWAMLLQHPTFKSHIITLFYSREEGTGKSSITKLLASVMGDLYSFFGSIENIMEKHSNAGVGRFINVMEELTYNKKYIEELKNLSQRTRGPYNEKNKTIIDIMYYVYYIICSNSHNCVKVPRGDRRYAIYLFKKLVDENHINRMDAIYTNKKIIYLFGNYLMTYKLSKEKFKRKWWETNKPKSKTYKLFLFNDSPGAFLKDLYMRTDFFTDNTYTDDIKEDKFLIKNVDLFDFYINYCDDMGISKKSKKNFYEAIRTDYTFIKLKNHNNVLKYRLDLKDIHKYLDMEGQFINKYNEEEKEDWIPKDNKSIFCKYITYTFTGYEFDYIHTILVKNKIINSHTVYELDNDRLIIIKK